MSVRELERHLVLFHYFLDMFGANDFVELKNCLVNVSEGVNETGRSYFLDALLGLKGAKISETKLVELDMHLQEFKERLRRNRADPTFNFKYFQYLALLFTELYLDRVLGGEERRVSFLNDLNAFLEQWNDRQGTDLPPFKKEDLRKIAYWMATGSGKTIIMHVNYWQVMRRSPEGSWDNLILLTPNEGLSRQHYQEFKASGIPCQLYEGNLNTLTSRPGEIIIIDIYKLTEEKKGRGVTIDVSYFEGRNLVFIDEGHKGQKSEERKWKTLREQLGKDGLIFEYSATFGQVIGKNWDLLEEYAKTIIFDYSYKHFYLDGHGKDFFIFNLREQSVSSSKDYKNLLLTACLLACFEQLILHEQHPDEMREYNIEKPLWVFVGSKVTGKKLDSDVMQVLRYLKTILTNPDSFEKWITKILSGKSGLVDVNGKDPFTDRFEFLKQYFRQFDRSEISQVVFQKMFHGSGNLQIHELKRADGELALKTADSSQYFGVINVGNVSSLKKLLITEGIPLTEDHLSTSLFFDINNPHSPIHVLIGAKKFVEGWNSWRVSTMGLLNTGKSEGPQIIQLFGRGVRLKGKHFSLKREEEAPLHVKVLQTLWIFGLNADYVNIFLENLSSEDVAFVDVPIPIRLNNINKWDGKIHVVTRQQDPRTQEIMPILLESDASVARKVVLDFRPIITTAWGFSMTTLDAAAKDTITEIPEEIIDVLDWEQLYLDMLEYKHEKRLFEVVIPNMGVLQEIIKEKQYHIKVPASMATLRSFKDVWRWQEIVRAILRSYLLKFHRDRILDNSRWHVKLERVTSNSSNLFPRSMRIVVRVPSKQGKIARSILKVLNTVEKWRDPTLSLFHDEHHLYSPLVVNGNHGDVIQSTPRKLNALETRFVRDMHLFLQKTGKRCLKGLSVFYARVLPHSRLHGSFDEAFRPDFIIWLVKAGKPTIEHVIYLNLMNVLPMGNVIDEKIAFCTSTIKKIEQLAREQLHSLMERKKSPNPVELHCHAFILSGIPLDGRIRGLIDANSSLEDLCRQQHVLFMEMSNPHYLEMLFRTVLEERQVG